ncbi:hypothetical protein [Staphylococcus chromogenes]|uniref:hypothetical protein n=1 Tax=Staphylococcus chromogenes TaxID=46126 RepID=UPI003D78D365
MTKFVLKNFTDKETGKQFVVGDEYDVEISKERLAALTTDDNAINEPVIVVVDDTLTKKEIIEIAKKLNIEVDEKGTKADILKSFK